MYVPTRWFAFIGSTAIDVTPAGHVLVPEMRNNRVVERDAEGKVVREVRVGQPIAALFAGQSRIDLFWKDGGLRANALP